MPDVNDRERARYAFDAARAAHWISPKAVAGVRVMVADKFGPRVVIDTHQHHGHHMIEFDGAEAARVWAAEFGRKFVQAEPEGAA